MTAVPPSPEIRAILNNAGELELAAVHAPDGAVIRVDLNAESPRMLCTQGQYLAPIQAPPGTRIRYRLFIGKKGLGEPETFVMPGHSRRSAHSLHADSVHPEQGFPDL